MFTNIPYRIFFSCYNIFSNVLCCNSDMCSPTQKDGWVSKFFRCYPCSPYKYRFICPSTEVFGTASIIVSRWINIRFETNLLHSGVSSVPVFSSQKARLTSAYRKHHISPLCSTGDLYISPLIFFFLIGAATPVFTWMMSKRFPKSFFKYVKWEMFSHVLTRFERL